MNIKSELQFVLQESYLNQQKKVDYKMPQNNVILQYQKIKMSWNYIKSKQGFQINKLLKVKLLMFGNQAFKIINMILSFIKRKALILYCLVASALKCQKRYEEIIKCYDEGIMTNKNDPVFYSYKYIELERQKRFDEAIQVWDLGIENNKTDPFYYKQKIQALRECFGPEQSQEQIIQCWSYAIQNGNDGVFYFKSKASALEQLERWDEIIECLNQGISMHKQVQLLYEDKAQYLKKLNKLEAIIECWDQGIEANPYTKYFYTKKIQALEEQEKIEQIIEESNHYIDLFDDMVFYEAKTKCLFKQGKVKELLECWDQGIKNNQLQSTFYIKKIEALELQNCWIDSIQCCDEVISKKVFNIQGIITHKVHSLGQLNNFRKASQYSRLINPNQPQIFQH